MRGLRREIAAVLFFKLLALIVIYFAFFNGSHRHSLSSKEMAAFLFKSN